MHWRPTRTPIIEVAYDNFGFLHGSSFVWVKSYGGAIQARHNEVDTQAHVGPAGILFGKLVCEEACDWRTANLNGFGVIAQVPFPIMGVVWWMLVGSGRILGGILVEASGEMSDPHAGAKTAQEHRLFRFPQRHVVASATDGDCESRMPSRSQLGVPLC